MATIQLRRGTAAQWTTADRVLLSGEIGIESDTNKMKIGDGTTAWTSLLYVGGSMSGADIIAAINASESTIDDNNIASTICRDSELSAHTGSTSNPHSVTKAQVGLTNVTDVAQLPSSYLETAITDSDVKVPSSGAVIDYTKSFKTPLDLRTTGYHMPNATSAGSSSTSAIAANYIYYYPMIIGHTDLSVTSIAINASAGATGNFRGGIYSDSGSCQPSARLAAFSEVSTNTTGIIESAGTYTLLAGQLYWIAIFCSAAPTLYYGATARVLPLKQISGSERYTGTAYRQSLTYTTLPDNVGTLTLSDYGSFALVEIA